MVVSVSGADPALSLTAGEVLDLAQYPGAADLDVLGGTLVVRDPSEDRVAVGSDGRAGFIELTAQGFYEIRDTDTVESAATSDRRCAGY